MTEQMFKGVQMITAVEIQILERIADKLMNAILR